MTVTERRRPAPPQDRPHQTDDRSATRQSSGPLYVWANTYAPAGRRSRWLHVVPVCPACGGSHAHLGGPTGGMRRSGCGRLDYFVRPRARLVAAA